MSQDDADWDRGAPMRHWLIRFLEDRPFAPFVIRLEGGFELSVRTPETIILEPGVQVATVYDGDEASDVFPIDRIVSLRKIG